MLLKNFLVEQDGIYRNDEHASLNRNDDYKVDTFDIDVFSIEDLQDYFDFLDFDIYEFVVSGDGHRLQALIDKFLNNNNIRVISTKKDGEGEVDNKAIKNGKLVSKVGIYPKGMPKNLIKHIFVKKNNIRLLEKMDNSVINSIGVNHGIYTETDMDKSYNTWLNIINYGEFPIFDNENMKLLINQVNEFIDNGIISWNSDSLPTDLGYYFGTNGLHRLIVKDDKISFSFIDDSNQVPLKNSIYEMTKSFTSMIDHMNQEVQYQDGFEKILPLLISIASSQRGDKVKFYTQYNGLNGTELYQANINNWVGYKISSGLYVLNVVSLRTFEVNELFMNEFHKIQKNIFSEDADEIIGILRKND